MKRPNFSKARIMFRRIRRRPADLINSGSNFLNRLLADIRQKEYVVFAEPILKPIKLRFSAGSGDSEAAQALKALEAVPDSASQVPGSAPEQDPAPTPPVYQDQAGEDVVDTRFAEEIFARTTPTVFPPEERHGLGGSDPSEQTKATTASPGPTGELIVSPSDGGDTPQIGADAPVKTASGVPGSAGITGTGTNQSRSANGPLFHTMVESLPDGQEHDGGLGDFLSEDLQDVFNTTDYTNPRTKALLKSREHVNVHELAKELKEYARSIGAAPPAPRIVNDQDQYSADRL